MPSLTQEEEDLLLELEKDDDALTLNMREKRMQEFKQQQEANQLMVQLNHGTFLELRNDQEVLNATISSPFVIVHFFHPDFKRCQIMNKHLTALATKHFKTKFVKANVENVTRLQIKVLPCVICFMEGVSVDRIVGFEELGNVDNFELKVLEKRLSKSGVLEAVNKKLSSSKTNIVRKTSTENSFKNKHVHIQFDRGCWWDIILNLGQFQEYLQSLPPDSVHVLITGDASCYMNWQAVVAYRSWLDISKRSKTMLGFTQVVHGNEYQTDLNKSSHFCRVPSFHTTVSSFYRQREKVDWYRPIQRPEALLKWTRAVRKSPEMLKGRWIALTDADVMFLKPIVAPNANDPNVKDIYRPYDYLILKDNREDWKPLMQRLYPDVNVTNMINGFPTYALLRFETFEKVVDLWEKASRTMYLDEEARTKIGWIREMYTGVIAMTRLNQSFDHYNDYLTQRFEDIPAIETIYDYSFELEFYSKETKQKVYSFNKRNYWNETYCQKIPFMQEIPESTTTSAAAPDGYLTYPGLQEPYFYQAREQKRLFDRVADDDSSTCFPMIQYTEEQ